MVNNEWIRFLSARLPFKVLSPKPDSGQGAQPIVKKRKLSDAGATAPKTKVPKNDENSTVAIKKNSKVDPAELEVSSSSEDAAKTQDAKKDKKPKCITLLDKFIRTTPTQQREVSTSGEVIDITDNETKDQTKPLETKVPNTPQDKEVTEADSSENKSEKGTEKASEASDEKTIAADQKDLSCETDKEKVGLGNAPNTEPTTDIKDDEDDKNDVSMTSVTESNTSVLDLTDDGSPTSSNASKDASKSDEDKKSGVKTKATVRLKF